MAIKTRVGPRGRVTIASALQRDTGLIEGTEVIIRSGGDGVVIVESVDAVKARILAAAPSAPPGTAYDAVADVRAQRDGETDRDDLLFQGDAATRPPPPGSTGDPGADLLRRLSL